MGKLLHFELVMNADNVLISLKLYDDIEIYTLLTPILLKLIPKELKLDFQKKDANLKISLMLMN